MSGKYVSAMSPEKLLGLIKSNSNLPIDVEEQSILHFGELVMERVRTLNEFEDDIRFVYQDPQTYAETGIRKYFSKTKGFSSCSKGTTLSGFVVADPVGMGSPLMMLHSMA